MRSFRKTATILIVIGVLVGVAGLGFFLLRKFKLNKSKKFNSRLAPLDFSAGGMPDEHEFKTTEGAFAGGEKRGDSDWERRERERSDRESPAVLVRVRRPTADLILLAINF